MIFYFQGLIYLVYCKEGKDDVIRGKASQESSFANR